MGQAETRARRLRLYPAYMPSDLCQACLAAEQAVAGLQLRDVDERSFRRHFAANDPDLG